jgi:hypothetical protein
LTAEKFEFEKTVETEIGQNDKKNSSLKMLLNARSFTVKRKILITFNLGSIIIKKKSIERGKNASKNARNTEHNFHYWKSRSQRAGKQERGEPWGGEQCVMYTAHEKEHLEYFYLLQRNSRIIFHLEWMVALKNEKAILMLSIFAFMKFLYQHTHTHTFIFAEKSISQINTHSAARRRRRMEKYYSILDIKTIDLGERENKLLFE